MKISTMIRRILPEWLVAYLKKIASRVDDVRYLRMSRQETFRRVYMTNIWGGSGGEINSGRGSSLPLIVDPYVAAVREFLIQLPENCRQVVDLGCGDFRVGRRFVDLCSAYIGVDIVPEVVAKLVQECASPTVRFSCIDIVSDELPEGRVCFLRQVLQHLSNDEILNVLPKLEKFEYVIVTEHFPSQRFFRGPNIDKSRGPHIRREYGSAVCLEHPPFNVDRAQLRYLVEVPGDGIGADDRAGVIRTFLLPGATLRTVASK